MSVQLAKSFKIPMVFMLLCLAELAVANSDGIEEILVTATRRPTEVANISAQVTVVDANSIQSQKLVTDSLAGQAGVYLQQTTPGQGSAIIRGLRGSAILHLVDGIRLNNAIFRSAPTQYLALVPISSVDRIEVVRGTPASLYGNDAVGGVVQLVTRVPEFSSDKLKFAGDVNLSLDSADLSKITRGTLDFGNAGVAASISGEYQDTGNRRTGSGGRLNPTGYTQKAARVVVATRNERDLTWLVDVHFLTQPNTPRIDELTAGFGQVEPSSAEFSFAPNRRLFVHSKLSQADGLWDLDWNIDAAWQRIVDDRRSRDFLSTERRLEKNRSDLIGLTANVVREHDDGSWIVGGEFYTDQVRSERRAEDILSGETQTIAPRFPDGSRVQQFAIYGNMLRNVSSRQVLSGGLRVASVNIDLELAPQSLPTSLSETDISGDIGWIFDLNETLKFTSNIGFGFRAPNIFDLGTLGARPGNRFNVPNVNLSSERVRQGDVGIRYAASSMQFDIAVFGLRYSDKITSELTGDITADGRDVIRSVNAAEATIFGAEMAMRIAVSDRWHVQGTLNYTRGEEIVADGESSAADRIPPINGSLNVDYLQNQTWSWKAWVRFADDQNRLSPRDVRDVRIDPQGTAGWGIVGLQAQLHLETGWRVRVGVDNILDKAYRAHGSGIDSVGRNWSLQVQRSWR